VEKVFRVTLKRTVGTPVVAVAGELDVATVPELERVLDALEGHVVVDCSSLRFMDAGALGALVRASNRVESLRLANVDSFVRKIIEVVELDALLLVAEPAGPDELDVPTPPPIPTAGE
jgi:anti-anti-sigma factor